MAIPPDAAATQRTQHGVISRTQALRSGLTEHQVRTLVERGDWSRLLPNVYLATNAALTWHAWAFAALLAAGAGAVLIGPTAAALRGWHPQQLPIHVAVPEQRRVRIRTSNIRVRKLDVPARETVSISGLLTTTRLRTAVDVAHLLPLGPAQQLLDRLLVLDLITLDALTESVNASRRSGSAQARRLVRAATDFAASEAERIAHRLLRRSGIRGWVANHPVTIKGRKVVIDIAFVELKVAIEIKGWAFHSLPDRSRGDDQRLKDLQRAGWLVLPFGWYELVITPELVVAEVREAITARVAV